jgi:peptidoglycan/LPS O-acetylase OafA/YrhL
MRIKEIDGIRGWASLQVIIFHFFHEAMGRFMPITDAWPLRFIFNGHLAVYVFFILSGFALSSGFLEKGDLKIIDKLAARRYFRLTTPILFSSLIIATLFHFNITKHQEAAQVLQNNHWLGQFLNYPPSFFSTIKFSLLDVYTAQSRESSINPFLWTMQLEMEGSLLLFLFLYASARLNNFNKTLALLTIALTVAGSYFSLFFLGICLSSANSSGALAKFRAAKGKWWGIVFLVLGIILETFPIFSGVRRQVNIIAASLITFGIILHPTVSQFFNNKISQFLGEISFAMYLLQFPVLITFFSAGVIWLAQNYYLDPINLTILGSASVVMTICLSWPFQRLESAILRLTNRWVDSLFLRPEANGTVESQHPYA